MNRKQISLSLNIEYIKYQLMRNMNISLKDFETMSISETMIYWHFLRAEFETPQETAQTPEGKNGVWISIPQNQEE